MPLLLLLVLLLGLQRTALTLNNSLGRTPGLGWNSDYCEVNCSGPLLLLREGDRSGAQPYAQNEAFVKHIADYMHSFKHKMASDGSMKTMQDLGWGYVNVRCRLLRTCLMLSSLSSDCLSLSATFRSTPTGTLPIEAPRATWCQTHRSTRLVSTTPSRTCTRSA